LILKKIIFFAAVTWDDIVPVGFDHPPGGAENANRSVFAFHYYEAPQLTLQPYFLQRIKDAQRLGTGVMLTEFEGKNFINSKATFDDVAAEADQHLLSWALWEFKDFCIHNETDPYYVNVTQWDLFGSCKTGYGGILWNDNGTVNMTTARHYARTYPHAVAGETQSISFDPAKVVFTLTFLANPNITQPTLIYVSENIFYSNGYNVVIQGAATWKKETENFVSVYNVPTSKQVTVTITAK